MGFLLQLRLLLWKNFILRKRQKVRLVIEILWPLLLFLILMWVRTRGLKEYLNECHYVENALPTAGWSAAIRSFLCNLNNACQEKAPPEDVVNTFNSSVITSLLFNIEEILGTYTNEETMKAIEEILKNLDVLRRARSQLITEPVPSDVVNFPLNRIWTEKDNIDRIFQNQNSSISPTDITNLLSSSINIDTLKLFSFPPAAFLKNPSIVLCNYRLFHRLFSSNDTSKLDKIRSQICALPLAQQQQTMAEMLKYINATSVSNQLAVISSKYTRENLRFANWDLAQDSAFKIADELQTLDGFVQSFRNLQRQTNMEVDPFDENIEKNVMQMVCGREKKHFLKKANDSFPLFMEDIRKDISDKMKPVKEYEFDNSTTDECNMLISNLEKNKKFSIFWLQIKPFIRGKILYFPNIPAVRKIMEKVNDSFKFFTNLAFFLVQWENVYSIRIQRVLKELQAAIKLMIEEESEPSEFPENLLDEKFSTMLQNYFIRDRLKLRSNDGENIMRQIDAKATVELIGQILDALENSDKWVFLLNRFLTCFEYNRLEPFTSVPSMMERAINLINATRLWAAVEFVDPVVKKENGSIGLKPHIIYKIRMDPTRIDNTNQIKDRIPRPGARALPPLDLKYIQHGFIHIQDLVERAIIDVQTNMQLKTGMWMQQFPYPCYIHDRFITAISRSFPLFMTLAWVYTAAMLIRNIVYEKEQRLKEMMRMMGLGNGVHWTGWFITSFVILLVVVILLTLVLKYGNVLQFSDPIIIFLFLLCYAVSTITFSFLISTWFNKANLAAAAGGIIFFVAYLPYPLLVRWNHLLTREEKIISALSSNIAFGFGCTHFAQFEEMGIGVQWNNVGKQDVRLGMTFTVMDAMTMLLIDSVIHMLLTMYIETVWPGEFGVPYPWYFFVTRTYWFGDKPRKLKQVNEQKSQSNDQAISELLRNEQPDSTLDFEPEPTHLKLGVSIKNLTKIYKNGKVAVNKLSLNFYEDQITSFLGHNGAGKTTTISILTGMYPPTQGTAYIYDIDIRTGMKEIRRNLGMCPQYNILFNFLTVEEHLKFYAGLKAEKYVTKGEEIDQMLVDLGLGNKRNALAKTLSGGMQRKLSISIAFIGGSKTIILDEPTAGIDPYSRRSIWELLIKYKKGKTIILTTHYMDEADLLGDRIAIIANGQLRCCGTSLFLKSRYGEGYYLTIVKKEPSLIDVDYLPKTEEDEGLVLDQESVAEDTRSAISNNDSAIASDKEDSPVTKLIKTHVPDAKLVEDLGLETTYILPTRTIIGFALENLLRDLDTKMNELKISSYGISDTNLEEVFLKVASSVPHIGDEVDEERKKLKPWQKFRKRTEVQRHQNLPGPSTEENEALRSEVSSKRTKGFLLLFSQFHALIVKRFIIRRRNVKGLFTEVVLPALFVCLALLFTLIIPPLGPRPVLVLTPWLFGPPNFIFYSTVYPNETMAKQYEANLINKPYLGARCVSNSHENLFCSGASDPTSFLYADLNQIPENLDPCDCSLGTPVCTEEQIGLDPPMARIATGDYLVNMTGRNISNWLVKTEKMYFDRRFGGYTLGALNPLSTLNISLLFDWIARLTGESYETISNNETWLNNGSNTMESSTNIKIWFNNQGWTSSVSYLNAINNVILRTHIADDKNPSEYGITLINHPVTMTPDEVIEELIRRSSVALLQAICVIFAMSFVPASFVIYLIDERISKFKHLQFVSGVERGSYWFINFFCDFINYLITAILCIFIFLAFQEQAYVSERNFFPLCLLLILYGWACIPLMYPVSLIINIPSAAFIALGCGNLFIGIITTVSTFTLEIMNDKELTEIANILKDVFLIFPHYCLGRGLIDMATDQLAKETLGKFGMQAGKDPFDWEFLGKKLFAMAVTGVLCFALVLCLEYEIFNKCKCWRPKIEQIEIQDEDEDVRKERQRIQSGAPSDAVIRVENLSKIYRIRRCQCRKRSGRNQLVAVKSLCFEVHGGECFGLLGVNGAGKTSTFQMLTGDTSVTSGNAILCGYSILTDMDKVQKHVGYCPQFDALHNLLTAEEHLILFARLRGIPRREVKKTVENSIRKLGLTQYSDKLARTYSGGNKRKLSTAIALIGEPQIIFLDEPTTGMDPKSKRFLWDCILKLTKEGKCIILTSHSMEECEALCTRLAIMVNGQFKCLGSIQHLKNKFGSGYLVTVRINTELSSVSQFIEFFMMEFPNAELTELHHNQVQFQLSLENLKLSVLFHKMEHYRNLVGIEDYSITQTTLDQVFVNFAKHQKDYVEESQIHTPARYSVTKTQIPTDKNGTVYVDGTPLKSLSKILYVEGEDQTASESEKSGKPIMISEGDDYTASESERSGKRIMASEGEDRATSESERSLQRITYAESDVFESTDL